MPLRAILLLTLLAAARLAAQNEASAYFERSEVTITNSAACAGFPDRVVTQPQQIITSAQSTIAFNSGDVTCAGAVVAGTLTFQALSLPAPVRGATTFDATSPLSLQMTQRTVFTRATTAAGRYTAQVAGGFPNPECRIRSDDNLNPLNGLPDGATVSNGSGGCEFTRLGLPFLEVEHQRYFRISNSFTASLQSDTPQNTVQVRITIDVVYRVSFPLLRLTPNPVTLAFPVDSSTPVSTQVVLENIGGHPLQWRNTTDATSTLRVTPETGPALQPGETTRLTVTATFPKPAGEYAVGSALLATNQAPTTSAWRAPSSVIEIRATVGGPPPEPPSTLDLTFATPSRTVLLEQDTSVTFSAAANYSHVRTQPTGVALEVLDQDNRKIASSPVVRAATGSGSQELALPNVRIPLGTTRFQMRAVLIDLDSGNLLRVGVPVIDYQVTGPTRIDLAQATVTGETLASDRLIVPVGEFQDPSSDKLRLQAKYTLPGNSPATIVFIASMKRLDGTEISLYEAPAPSTVQPGSGVVDLEMSPQLFYKGYDQVDWSAEVRTADGRRIRSNTFSHLYEWIRFRRCTLDPLFPGIEPGAQTLDCEVRLNVRRSGGATLGYRLTDSANQVTSGTIENVSTGVTGIWKARPRIQIPDASAGPIRLQFFLEGEPERLGSARISTSAIRLPVRSPAVTVPTVAGESVQSPQGVRLRAVASSTAAPRTVRVIRDVNALAFASADFNAGVLPVDRTWRFDPPIPGADLEVTLLYDAVDLPAYHPDFDVAKVKVYSFDPESGAYREFPSTVDAANRTVTARLPGLPSVLGLAMPGPLRRRLVGVPLAPPDTTFSFTNLSMAAEPIQCAGLSSQESLNPFPNATRLSVASGIQENVSPARLFPQTSAMRENSWIAAFGPPATLAMAANGSNLSQPAQAGARQFVIPAIAWDSASTVFPEIHLANPNDYDAGVVIELRDAAGVLVAATELHIAPWAKWARPVPLEFDLPTATRFNGWVRVIATRELLAGMMTSPTAVIAPAPEVAASTVRIWVAPYFQAGPGSKLTRVVLLNSGPVPMQVTVRAYSDFGALLASSQLSLASGEQVSREVSQLLPLDARSFSAGSLRFETDVPGLAGALLVDSSFARPLDPVSLAAPDNPVRFATAFPDVAGSDMGSAEMLFVNPGSAAVNVSARVFASAGTPLVLPALAIERTVPAGGRWSGSLSSWLPETSRRSTGGYVVFEAPRTVLAAGFTPGANPGNLAFASLQAVSNGPINPPPGNSTDLIFSPPSVDFGPVARGQSQTRRVALRNPSFLAPVTITGVSFSDVQFRISAPSFPFTIPPDSSVTIDLVFSPAPGSPESTVAASVTFGNGQKLNLTASIIISETPRFRIEVTPPGLDFGNVNSGQTRDLTVAVRNTGSELLTIENATVAGSNRFQVQFVNFPLTLAPLVTQNLQVRFSPAAPGTQLGTLTIASSDPVNPAVTVNLVGTGVGNAPSPRIFVSVSSLEFGTLPLNTSTERTFEVRNTGTGSLTIQSISIDNASYTSGPPAPFTLAPGAIADVGVVFRPRTAGPQNAVFSIVSNDPNNGTVKITLTGAGQQ